MHRLTRLLPALVFFAFVLLFPAEMRADPLVITGGSVTIFGAPNSRNAFRGVSFNFSGEGVSVSGGVTDGQGRQQPTGPCAFEGCQPGTLVSSGSNVHSDGVGSALINGTTYGAWFFGGDTVMTFNGGSVIVPDGSVSSITLSTNFSMTGTLIIHDINTSGLPAVFTSPIIGQGTAFLTFQFFEALAGRPSGYVLSRIRYDFAETPEPATLLLLGTGLAGAAGYRRRRKRGKAQ